MRWTGNGLADATTITTGNVNTTGNGDTVTASLSGTPATFRTGGDGFDVSGTASTIARLDATITSSAGIVMQDFFTYSSGVPSAVANILDSRTAGTQRGTIRLNTTGRFDVLNGATTLATSTNAATSGHRYRLDMINQLATSTTGRIVARIEDMDDATWPKVYYDSGATLSLGTTNFAASASRIGLNTGTYTGTNRHESIGWDVVTLPGGTSGEATMLSTYFMTSPYTVVTTQPVMKRWNGTAYVTQAAYRWNGTAYTLLTQRTLNPMTSAGQKIRASLAKSDESPIVIAYTGSSTTFGNNASTAAKRYVNVLSAQFRTRMGSGGTTSTMNGSAHPSTAGLYAVNGGVGGTTSANYIDATTLGWIGTLQPEMVFHMIGSNDYSGNVNPTTYKSNVLATIASIDAAITGPAIPHLLIQSYQRIDVVGTYPWDAYGQALKDIAAADPTHIAYIDLNPEYVWRGIPGSNPDGMIDTDGIHQVDAGHAYMAKLLFNLILGEPIPIVTLVSDDFNRANGSLGTAPTGQTWAVTTGTAAIASNKAAPAAGGSAIIDSASVDVDVSADLTWGSNTAGILFRCNSTETDRMGVFQDGATSLTMYKKVAGTTTATSTITHNATGGATFNLRCRVISNQVQVFIDGVLQAIWTIDSAAHTATKTNTYVGIRGSSGTHTFDNFLAKTW